MEAVLHSLCEEMETRRCV